MDVSNTPSVTPPVTPETTAPAGSSTKVLGIERRLIGFGFGLLLVLASLAVVYSIYTRQPGAMPAERSVPTGASSVGTEQQSTRSGTPAVQPVTGAVTPDRVADDLIDEALADQEDLSSYDSDEMADVEEGNNN